MAASPIIAVFSRRGSVGTEFHHSNLSNKQANRIKETFKAVWRQIAVSGHNGGKTSLDKLVDVLLIGGDINSTFRSNQS